MKSVFRNTTFRRLFAGRLITNMGDSLYYIAAMWLAYELGGSAFYTGLAGFLTLAPQALQFLTGPFVDRWDIRRLLVGTQVLQGALVLVIPIAAWTGQLSVMVVLVVMPVVSMLNQFVYPAQSAALPRIVREDELTDANSAFSFAYQGTDLVFAGLGGVFVALVGAVSLYLADSVTFAVATLVFATVHIPAADGSDTERVASAVDDYTEKLTEGIDYVRGSVLALILVESVLVNAVIGATMAVLPAFAELRGGSETYGFLLAAISAGLLVGALCAAPLKRFSLSRLTIVGFAVSAVVWFGAVATNWLPATLVLFCLAWLPIGVTNVVFAAMTQTYVPEHLLGRVTSVTTSASAAAMPVGSLLGGLAGETWGAEVVVAATGVGFLFVAGYWFFHPLLRRVPALEDLDPTKYGLGRAERTRSVERSPAIADGGD
ncbi:MAG TPA: MFS transporter [Halococcus sp.]|nr:MFS transporter [Halococcus sp.]